MNWSYTFGERTSLGLSVNSRDPDYDQRNVSVYGRYWFAPTGRSAPKACPASPPGLLRLQDIRIGVQRRF